MLKLIYTLCFLFSRHLWATDVIMDPENASKSKSSSLVRSYFNDTKSYAGFFNVRKHSQDDYLFFWFFPHADEKAPLIVWIQGQPGLSSLYSLFEETGPYEIDNEMQLKRRKYALTNTYNVLYLDPETYCGFSHANHSHDLYYPFLQIPGKVQHVLNDFFQIFSEYRNNDLYIAGASSNSEIISKFAFNEMKNIGQMNHKLNLKGLIIGGGLFNMQKIFHYFDILLWNGLTDTSSAFSEFQRRHYNIRRYIQAGQSINAMEEVGSMMSALRLQGYATMYDLRDAESPVSLHVANFVIKPAIREALHVSAWPFQHETMCIVRESLIQDAEIYTEVFSNYRILLYNGQFDLLSPYIHSSEFLVSFTWPYLYEYYNANRVNWIHNGHLIGYWTQAGTLLHAMIRNAGHFVGKSQPEALYLLFDNFIKNKFAVNVTNGP